MKTDIYQIITDRIVKQLENGIIPWRKPWHGVADGARSYITGKPYSLLNQMLLEDDGEYITYNQAKNLVEMYEKAQNQNSWYFIYLF